MVSQIYQSQLYLDFRKYLFIHKSQVIGENAIF